MFKFLVTEEGTRRDINIYPEPESLRESFVLWAMKVFAPRLTAVSISKDVQHLLDSEGARHEWRLRMKEWNHQRLEDVTVLEMSLNEATGELEI